MATTDEQNGAGQRRHITVLFADIADFTPLAEQIGEEATFDLVRRVTAAESRIIEKHGGSLREFAGDGVMALFGAPVALEDAPLKACRAALEIARDVPQIARQVAGASDVAVRVGVHSGPVVLGSVGEGETTSFTALGDTVNLAARLQEAADPGSVVVSEATHDLVQGYVVSEFVGERALKGKSAAQRLFRLRALRPDVSRFDVSVARGLTGLIGRGEEIAALQEHWRRARQGQVLAVRVVGHIGIGKTRLLHELRQRIGDATWLVGQCEPQETASALHPFRVMLRRAFGLADDDSQQRAERRLQRGLELLGLDPAPMLPYLLNLVGFAIEDASFSRGHAEVAGQRTREALLDILRAQCRQHPTVLVLEDSHWLDAASAALVARFHDEAGLPLLIIDTCRVGSEVELPGAPRMPLDPLTDAQIAELVRTRLAVAALPDVLQTLVVARAEGNPLFAEEIVDYLRDKGHLHVEDGTVRFDAPAGLVLPVNLQNLLMSRFDDLAAPARRFVEVAAVAGREFDAAVVAAVAEVSADTVAAVEALGLIEAQPGSDRHRFRSLLVLDGVYDSLLGDRRREIHQRLGEAIEHASGNRLSEVAELLARHFVAAEDPGRAIRYLALAGDRSLRVYDLEQAADRLRRCLDLAFEHPAAADDHVIADAALSLSRVLYYLADFTAIPPLMERVRPLFERLGDQRLLARLYFETGYVQIFGAELEAGRANLARSLEIAENNADELGAAYVGLGMLWDLSTFHPPSPQRTDQQARWMSRVVAAGEAAGDNWLLAKAHVSLAFTGVYDGQPAEARRHALASIALSRDSGDPRPRVLGLATLSLVDGFLGEAELAIEEAQAAIDTSLCPVDRLMAQAGLLGGRLLVAAERDDPAALLREAVELGRRMEAAGNRLPGAIPGVFLGVALFLNGRFSEGVQSIERAATEAGPLGHWMARPLANYFLGQIYAQFVTGGQRPPLRILMRNFGFLLRTLPRAARLAEQRLGALVDDPAWPTPGFFQADALYRLGLIHAARNRPERARDCFARARVIAESVGADALVEKLDAA